MADSGDGKQKWGGGFCTPLGVLDVLDCTYLHVMHPVRAFGCVDLDFLCDMAKARNGECGGGFQDRLEGENGM